MYYQHLRLIILSFFLLMFASCEQQVRRSVQTNAAVNNPVTNPLTISTHQGVSRYQVFIHGKKMLIFRQGGNIIISYPSLVPFTQVHPDIVLSPGSNEYNEANAFLSSVFEFRAETVMVTYMGTIANEIIFNQNGNEITISDANVKKFNLNLVQNNQVVLAKLYLNNQRVLNHALITYYLQIAWP